MKSPKDMNVIQIEITNACVNRCSNCTRFCGHHRKPFFMDFPTFTKAVQSMKGFKGVVGIMGGEPTIHPEFPKFIKYFREHHGFDDVARAWQRPGMDFIRHVERHQFDLVHHNRRGLWSSITAKYAENFEAIQDTFSYQCLNDHSTASMHQPLLVSRKELGISDEEWYPLRDACWVQNYWSASVSPKGAFFCEIAAALDMLLDGPGGWPIEQGWWEREPKDFSDQLHWCELCSAALPMPSRDARLGIDDISPRWREILTERKSPKVRRNHVSIFDTANYNFNRYEIIHNSQPYLSDNSGRLMGQRKVLAPRSIAVVLQVDSTQEVAHRMALLDAAGGTVAAVVTGDTACAAEAAQRGLRVFSPNISVQDISHETNGDWLLITRNTLPQSHALERFSSLIFNPGTLYWQGKRSDAQPDLLFLCAKAATLATPACPEELRSLFADSKQYMLPDNFTASCSLYYVSRQIKEEGLPAVFTPVSLGNLASGDEATPIWSACSREPVMALLHLTARRDRTSDIVGLNGENRFFLFGQDISPYQLIESDKLRFEWLKDIPEDMAMWDSEEIRHALCGVDMAVAMTVPVRFLCPDTTTVGQYIYKHCDDAWLERFNAVLEASGYAGETCALWTADAMVTQPLFIMSRPLFEEFYAFADSALSDLLDVDAVCALPHDGEDIPAILLTLLLNIFLIRQRECGKTLRHLPYAEVRHGAKNLAPMARPDDSDAETPLVVSACGKANLPFAGAWLASLCEHGSPERHYDVVLLAGNISEEDSYALKLQAAPYPHIRFRILDCSSLDCAEEAYRIHIPALFPDYDKALYTDPHTIFCCDPVEVFTRDLGDAYCAAVAHHFKIQGTEDKKRLFTYPDVAVLLLNLTTLRNSDVQQSMYGALRAGLPIHEVIAKALDGEFLPLPADTCVSANFEMQAAQPVLLRAQHLARTAPRIINFNFSEDLLRQATGLATCFWHAARSSYFYESLHKILGHSSQHADIQQSAQVSQKTIITPLQPAKTLQERLFFRLRPTQAVVTSLLRSGAFDIPYYMAANPDVVERGMDPILHYVLHGWKEGRDPAPWFHTRQYLKNYPDVATSGMNPFYHYMVYGINEQRCAC